MICKNVGVTEATFEANNCGCLKQQAPETISFLEIKIHQINVMAL